MRQNNTIPSITTDLLAHGAFSHLKDDEVAGLHHLIVRLKEPLSPVQQNLLLTLWYHADTGNFPPGLFYRCNAVLQKMGRNLLNEQAVEMEIY
jgi:hypothetical protein